MPVRAPRALPRQIPPKAIEASYAGALVRAVIAPCHAAVAPLRAALRTHQDSAGARLDAASISTLLAQAKAKLTKVVHQPHVEAIARRFAGQTHGYQRVQLDRQLVAGLGVKPLVRDKGLDRRVDTFVRDNVKLVTKIPQRLRDDLEDLVGGAVRRGELNPSLADKIGERLGVEETRARLIARDQIAKLYADVNHARQQDLGITKFVWRCLGDERVRGKPGGKYPDALPSHWDLHGKTFSYDDPPQPEGADEPILPGDDVQCRCYSEPVLSDLLDDNVDYGTDEDDNDEEED